MIHNVKVYRLNICATINEMQHVQVFQVSPRMVGNPKDETSLYNC